MTASIHFGAIFVSIADIEALFARSGAGITAMNVYIITSTSHAHALPSLGAGLALCHSASYWLVVGSDTGGCDTSKAVKAFV
ncbi:hypothetical protein PF008_g2779 [Phytophthora fragariae]|uniref:Uncharacterized protein n=1 Tax=Phytophthora fragariae TaxID=53985 RepID=A0A6G0SGU8_9STRA|nr:hypothetical protein PF008_g2779 [Phytophthora fragariae]